MPDPKKLVSWHPYENGGITAVYIFMASRVFTACDRQLNVWSTRTKSCIQRIQFPIAVTSDTACMDPSGRYLVVSSLSIDFVLVLEVESSSFKRVFKYSSVLYPISMTTQVKLAVNKNVDTLADVTNKRLSVINFYKFLWIFAFYTRSSKKLKQFLSCEARPNFQMQKCNWVSTRCKRFIWMPQQDMTSSN